jgi:arylsulfatase A-like enzyme
VFIPILLCAILSLTRATYRMKLSLPDIFALILIGLASSLYLHFRGNLSTSHNFILHSEQPNIFLISIEALRPDYITQQNTMPFLTEILKDSIQFTDAYTPIAQSLPAWISILTGKTPIHHGVRGFYANYAKIDLQDMLTKQLKKRGYETIYAVDGQRFGELTTQLGFDRIISPPSGAAELLIGSMSDFPLSNLLLTTRIGKYLFPYSYANRAIATTYRPDDFIELLTSALRSRRNKPLFLSIHFSTSHWPYHFADDQLQDHGILTKKYSGSLRAVDAQLKQFYDLLYKEHLLNHAIVIFLSDHGIGLGMPGDSLTNEEKFIGRSQDFSLFPRLPYSHNDQNGIDTSYGYSTNILSLQQFHVLFAVKTFGLTLGTPRQIDTRVSLIDISPTIMDVLKIPQPQFLDGMSLLNLMNETDTHQISRAFFIENGFTSPEIANAHFSEAEILQNTIQAVALDQHSGLFYLTDFAENQLLKKKQRGLLIGDWLLARSSPGMMVLANIKTGEWSTDLHSVFANHAGIEHLLRDFKKYNQSEI